MTWAESNSNQVTRLDAVVIGAGFAGLYALYRLRNAGLATCAYEAGGDVGGVWYWNRYPGARCDSESIYYNYTFSDELLQEWTWTARYPGQPEILRYLNFVADKFDLRRDIQFSTRVQTASYDAESGRWRVSLDDGSQVSAQYLITGVGCLSAVNVPDIPGRDQFAGEWYHTGNWPQEGVSFEGKRVGVIGTGSSGIQSIPIIAQQSRHLTVFQRTPQYTVPARNHSFNDEYVRKVKRNYDKIRHDMYNCWGGLPFEIPERSALEDNPEQREAVYQQYWDNGGEGLIASSYNDLLFNAAANDTAAEFIRSRIRETVTDPETAEKLQPTSYYGTKRPILDTDYYETYNRDNVSLVDLRPAPIKEITATGLRTADAHYELDVIVFATGYDALTGSLFKMDIRGRDDVSLREAWDEGARVRTYLGLATAGFPNMFMITGPESPSVLTNMPTAVEQHVDWITDCIAYLRDRGVEAIEATTEAQEAWSKQCDDVANATLFPGTDSWYTGANIAGKQRGRFPIYLAGFDVYQRQCNQVAENGYEGFVLMASEDSAVAAARADTNS